MREGILGGSFDPVHNAHLHIAREAMERLSLDRVVFMPANRPPHKKDRALTPGDARLAMVTLAIADEPRFQASDAELRREGPSYTIDTVSAERARLGPGWEIFFLVGADQALELGTWRRIGELATMCALVAVTRPGLNLGDVSRLTITLVGGEVVKLKLSLLEIPPMDVSSTEIRRRVKAGESIEGLVPPEVERYIREHGLYR